MTPYKNLSGNSGVSAYDIGDDFIKVRFVKNPKVYVYDYSKPGHRKVERMKVLAIAGKGLATYIAQKVRENYSRSE